MKSRHLLLILICGAVLKGHLSPTLAAEVELGCLRPLVAVAQGKLRGNELEVSSRKIAGLLRAKGVPENKIEFFLEVLKKAGQKCSR